MLIEMRRYAIERGRMDGMHARMSDMLIPLFDAHDMPRPFAVWEGRDGSSILTWMLQWDDFDARQAAWARVGPAFAAARARQDIAEFVTRTSLTLIAPWAGHRFDLRASGHACETAWHVQPRIGFGGPFMAACEGGVFDRFRAAGATSVTASNLMFGALPQAIILLGWPDVETRRAGEANLRAEPMPGVIAEGLTGDGAHFGDRGEWESLDRAPYLERWGTR